MAGRFVWELGADLGAALGVKLGVGLGVDLGALGAQASRWFERAGWLGLGVVLGAMGLGAWAWAARRQGVAQQKELDRERRLREESEAYALIDIALAAPEPGRTEQAPAPKALAMQLCRVIADKSAFRRAMVLLRDGDGRLRCMGSVGVDDLTVAAIDRWAERVVVEERSGAPTEDSLLGRNGAKAVPISLGEWGAFDAEISTWRMTGHQERRRYRRAVVLPIRTVRHGVGPLGGRIAGAIVVCTDGMAGRSGGPAARVERLLSGLESLAARLGTAFENESLNERLLRAEKMAGLGQVADGVAHALNDPLTAVLGFAELIAETSTEARVQADAQTIVGEATRMKATVAELVRFYQTSWTPDETVEVTGLVRELAAAFETRLAGRGVHLELALQEQAGLVRGSQERLSHVVGHLLNNAAAAVLERQRHGAGRDGAGRDGAGSDAVAPTVRLSTSQDEHTLYVIISDSGPGFEDPARAFDPFLARPEQGLAGLEGVESGPGLGLSICYRIVREHGGEIEAFNLEPHGAAVVVELPLRHADDDPAPKVLVKERMIA